MHEVVAIQERRRNDLAYVGGFTAKDLEAEHPVLSVTVTV